jgi:hypothetical protein
MVVSAELWVDAWNSGVVRRESTVVFDKVVSYLA